ncbi:MAG: TonB-dependent receptor [Thermodesulfobacteriota bacterium]|nr:TonB-dependent receptor [Thermodesulfobacteriota bacterium]
MHLRNLPCALIITIVLCCTHPSLALANETITEVEFAPIVTTATRTPEHLNNIAQSIAIIDRADIKAAPADSLADLLEYVSGVDVRQRAIHGVQADVSIRGGSFEQTLVLLDGISLSNPQTGHHNMDIPVNLNEIERIEIIKGSGARIYGANAMAGVINIITRSNDTPSISAQLKTGEYDCLASSIQTNFTTGKWDNSLSATQQYSSGFEDDEPTGFNIKSVSYRGHGQMGSQEMETGLAYTDKDFGASRFYFNAPYQKEHIKALVSYLAANLRHGLLNWRPQVSWLHHDDTYTSAYGINDTETDKYTFLVSGNTTSSWGQSNFGLGVEREEIDSSNMGNHERNNHSLFVNHKLAVTDSLTIGAGTSAVYYSDWGWEYLPGAEASYTINDNLQWFASVAKSVRIPTYTELYYTIGNIGDSSLKTEDSWTWENGLRWQQKRLSANLSVFLRESDNLIDWSRASSATTWKVRNVAECNSSGIEVGFDLKQPFSAIALIGRIALSYTYLDHDTDSGGLESKYIFDSLRHQLHGTVYLDWHPRISHVIKMRFEERMTGDSSTVLDTKVTYQATNNVELSIEASNLFDEDYIESGDAPMPGRWIMAGISLHHDFI